MRRAATFVAAAAALVLPAQAGAARFAVGVDQAASLPRVAQRLQAFGPVSRDLTRLHVVVVDAPTMRGVKRIDGVRWAEWLGARNRRVAFMPSDPLASRQWYLATDRAFDFWPEAPILPPVKVAVVDSGIDVTHPDFAGRIADTRSLRRRVRSPTRRATARSLRARSPHRSTTAKASPASAFSSQLLVAKVVRADGTISLEAEAKAIRWAVDAGARVINLSLGGLRDPNNPSRDTYSPLEAAAVDYAAEGRRRWSRPSETATRHRARRGRSRATRPRCPTSSASARSTREGSVSSFSDRDAVYNDIAAPGEDILSTLPRALTARQPDVRRPGLLGLRPGRLPPLQGTSFAAPQVAAAAALLLAQHPTLTADQVATILERSAVDAECLDGLLRLPGASRRALAAGAGSTSRRRLRRSTQAVPPADRFETNDDVGAHARTSGARGQRQRHGRLLGRPDRRLPASTPPRGQRLSISLSRHGPRPPRGSVSGARQTRDASPASAGKLEAGALETHRGETAAHVLGPAGEAAGTTCR